MALQVRGCQRGRTGVGRSRGAGAAGRLPTTESCCCPSVRWRRSDGQRQERETEAQGRDGGGGVQG